MQFSFEAKVVLTMAHDPGSKTSKHVATDFNLYPKGNLLEAAYVKNEVPTQEGSRVLSMTLVQGLVGNIHFAHEKGFRDSAEHLRWIISELEKGFVAVAEVQESTFDD